MKRPSIFILFLVLGLGVETVSSQEVPLYNQYLLNNFLLNPAIAGNKSYPVIRLTDRLQWAGFPGAPNTGALSAHARAGKHSGLGGIFFNDKSGAVRNTGAQFAYAFHATLFRALDRCYNHKFALGLSGSFSQFNVDVSNFQLAEPESLEALAQNVMVPDVNAGAYFYNNRYFVGISTAQLLQSFLKTDNYLVNEMHFFVNAGFWAPISQTTDIEPSILVKKTPTSPTKVDANLKFYFKKNFWVAASYRMYFPSSPELSNTFMALAGAKVLNRFHLGYAFGYTSSTIMSNSYGSHEIVLGIDLQQGSRPRAVPCPSFFQ